MSAFYTVQGLAVARVAEEDGVEEVELADAGVWEDLPSFLALQVLMIVISLNSVPA